MNDIVNDIELHNLSLYIMWLIIVLQLQVYIEYLDEKNKLTPILYWIIQIGSIILIVIGFYLIHILIVKYQ